MSLELHLESDHLKYSLYNSYYKEVFMEGKEEVKVIDFNNNMMIMRGAIK